MWHTNLMRATSETNPLRVGLMIDDSLDGHHGVGTYVKDLGR